MNLKISLKYLLFALYPVLGIYIILPGITLGNLVLFLFFIYKLFQARKVTIDTELIVAMIFFICSNLFQIIINRDVNLTLVLHNTYAMGLFLIVTLSMTMDSDDDLSRLYRYLKIVAVICAIGLFFQHAVWNIFDRKTFLFIPGIERIAYQEINATIFRPGGFFTEPSHLAIYLLPLFALSLIKKDYFFSAFILITIIFSTSSLGIITAVIVVLWHFREFFFKRITKKRLLLAGIFIFASIAFFVLFKPDIVRFALGKLMTIFGKDSSPRLFGTLNYIGFFRFSDYIFGIGLNQFAYLVELKLGITVMASGEPLTNYSNSLVFSFISFGIIGLAVWIFLLYSIVKKLPQGYFTIGLAFLCVCATDQVLFNHNLTYLFVILRIVTRTRGFTKVAEMSA
jgi:hypothetical protein